MNMTKYEVKVKVVETHYITVEAKNIAEAEDMGESYGFHAQDAISTEVEVESVQVVK